MHRNWTADFEALLVLIGRFGRYRAPVGVGYAMALIIRRLGGWVSVCDWEYEEMEYRRQAFQIVYKQVYDLLAMTPANLLAQVDIAGLHESVTVSPLDI